MIWCNYIRTDIIRVEVIHSNKDTDGSGAQRPGRNGPNDRELARVEVVHAARVELGEVRSAYTNFP